MRVKYLIFLMMSLLVGLGPQTIDAADTTMFRIAYWSSSDNEIWTINPDGTDAQQITHDGVDKRGLVASPDGRYLAYYVQSWYDGANTNNLTYQVVVVLDMATGEQQMITGQEAINHLGWSPDSQQLLFIILDRHDLDMSYEVNVVNRDGSGRARLGDGEGWTTGIGWSPDGKHILIGGWDNESHYHISIMDGDGKHLRELTRFDSCFICLPPRWTPDGQAIVFYRHPDLYIMDTDGQHLRQLTDFAQVYNVIDVAYARYNGPQYALSSDSKQLVYVMGYPLELVKLNLGVDSWKQRSLIYTSPAQNFQGVLLSPDNQSAFVQIGTESGQVLTRVALDTGAIYPVVSNAAEPVILSGA